MDYKEKYEQALEYMRTVYPTLSGAAKEDVEYHFPELKESEDERIRKHLLKHFRNKTKEEWNGMPVKNILTWLEKLKDYEDELEKAYKCADEVQYRKGFEDGVASVKPAEWSEEDERMVNSILTALKYFDYFDEKLKKKVRPKEVIKEMNWLISLRERMKGE